MGRCCGRSSDPSAGTGASSCAGRRCWSNRWPMRWSPMVWPPTASRQNASDQRGAEGDGHGRGERDRSGPDARRERRRRPPRGGLRRRHDRRGVALRQLRARRRGRLPPRVRPRAWDGAALLGVQGGPGANRAHGDGDLRRRPWRPLPAPARHDPAGEAQPVWAPRRGARAPLLGKANLQELAFVPTSINPHYGAVRNPWDPDRISGGSSGGSAAAVVAGAGLGSIGTDTGGSIRCPAALCGATGLKPTYGRVPRTGVFPLSDSQDHVGPIATTALDCAILLDAIAGPDGRDVTVTERTPPRAFEKLTAWSAAAPRPSLNGVRLGVVRSHRDLAQPVVREAFDRAATDLASLGAELV